MGNLLGGAGGAAATEVAADAAVTGAAGNALANSGTGLSAGNVATVTPDALNTPSAVSSPTGLTDTGAANITAPEYASATRAAQGLDDPTFGETKTGKFLKGVGDYAKNNMGGGGGYIPPVESMPYQPQQVTPVDSGGAEESQYQDLLEYLQGAGG